LSGDIAGSTLHGPITFLKESHMKPTVRVLIVTDDGLANGGFLKWSDQAMPAAVGPNSREFHLGEFLRVLQGTAWLGFNVEITKAHRSLPGTGGLNEAALKADRGADLVGFRFNQPFIANGQSHTLADYDMVLFFAINPSNPNPTLAPEAEAIAQFMENGGGFFATGDHENLGGELCGLIPRVRSMRRWWVPAGPNGEPEAPPALGPDRHDTTRPGADNIGQFEDQSDEFAQEIAPAFYGAGLTVKQGYIARRSLPHPLLCSPDGVVRYLPDHMHEGSCEVPDNLAARTFTLGSTSVREYPDYAPPSPPAGYVAEPLAPEIVATGHVVPGTTSPALDTDAHFGSPDPAHGVSFGVIGAWDGHRVSKGRVVVDSTWHHFFNINVTGDRYLEDESLGSQHEQKKYGFFVPDGMGGRVPNAQYQMIMWYYRNIVYWLIPAKRHELIYWNALAEIVKRPQLVEELGGLAETRSFERYQLSKYLYFAQLAEAYLTQARGACAVYTIREILYKPKIPWWEWIQEYVDVWDPLAKTRNKQDLRNEHLLGALGVAPRADTAAMLGIGAAIVAVASVRREFAAGDPARGAKAAQAAWPRVLEHALGEFGKQLAAGAEVQRNLTKVIGAKR
jgi:hypothetical protein